MGHLLANAREKMGVSVEEAARETRIHVDRIRDMEGDQLFQFTHPSYARMFLRDYARYLNFPQERLRTLLPDGGESMSDGLSYITRYSAPERTSGAPPRRKRGGILFVFLAALFLGLAGYQIWKAASAPAVQPVITEEVDSVEDVEMVQGEPADPMQELAEDASFLSQGGDADIPVATAAEEVTFSSLVPENTAPELPQEGAPLQINPSAGGTTR